MDDLKPPKFPVPPRWGLCFSGNESAFCSALDFAISNLSGRFVYIEIGIGYGATISAVSEYLDASGVDFEVHGVDVPEFAGNAADTGYYSRPKRTSLHLCGSKYYFAEHAKPANFVFIDGCHGAPCAKADFLGAEKIVKVGGVVAFHDTDPGCQDIHLQPHCKTGIRVRSALEDLGLLTNDRHGWTIIGETSGNKSQSGHGCVFLKRDA